MKNTNKLDENDDLSLVNAGIAVVVVGLIIAGVVAATSHNLKTVLVILWVVIGACVIVGIALVKVLKDKDDKH